MKSETPAMEPFPDAEAQHSPNGDSQKESINSEWKLTKHEFMIMITLSIASLMVSIDATIIITSLSTMVQALGASTTEGFWIGTSYLLSCAVTMPFIASISDIFGRPFCLFFSVLYFTVGSIVCATAHRIGVLLTGRSIQGVGGGGVIILTLVIFSDIVPLRFRPRLLGITQASWALGTCIGPVIGGALASPHRRRWVFYLMLPFCGIVLAFIPIFVRLKPRQATLKEMLVRVDWIGGFLFIASATSFLMAISWGGVQEAWSSFRTIVPLVLGIVGLMATVLWERFGAREPFLRHSLFHNGSALATYSVAFVQGLLLHGQLYYFSFYFAAVKLHSPVHIGVNILACTVTLVPGAIIVGALITRTGRYRWAICVGWFLNTLCSGRCELGHHFHNPGVGQGLLINSLIASSQASCLPGDEAAAAAMYAFIRSFGMAFGVGIGGSVFQNVMKTKLRSLNLPTSIAVNAEGYVSVLQTLGDTPQRTALLAAYTRGFQGVFGFCCGLAGVSLILVCCFIKQFDIDKALVTEHTLNKSNRASWHMTKMESSLKADTEGSRPGTNEVVNNGAQVMHESENSSEGETASRE